MRTMIHEIRNQLAVAVANVEAFVDGKLQPTPERLQGVLQVLNELDLLIDGLRPFIPSENFASTVPPTNEPEIREIDICALISNEALALEATALAKGIHYEIVRCDHKHPACARFQGDPGRIAQIVQNVLLNAVRYTSPGGTIHVDCRRSCSELVFSVRDNGAGIAAHEQETIFQSGFRGSASEGTAGSGLGLSLVKRFVEEHGGKVLVRSDVGQGATFTVALPGVPKEDEVLLPRVL